MGQGRLLSSGDASGQYCPGLHREFLFEHWQQQSRSLSRLRKQAFKRHAREQNGRPRFFARDINANVLEKAKQNAKMQVF